MAEVQNADKDPAGRSTKVKRLSPASERLKYGQECRAGVDIGMAFERGRDVKAAKGLRSDKEVALCLLDEMKQSPSRSTSSGPTNKMIKFSLSEVKTLIKQEVRSELRRNENKLQLLIDTVQNLDPGVNYGKTIQELETRLNTLTKRAEAALVHMTNTQKKSTQQPPDNMDVIRIDSEDERMETASQGEVNDFADTMEELFHEMKTTEKTLKKIHAENEEMKAAMATPPAVTADESPMCEKGPEEQKTNLSKMTMTEQVKEECLSLNTSNTSKDTDSEQDKPSYPPLPPNPFPSTMKIEAASFNIPQKLDVHLALIREPPGLSVLWKVEKEDPLASPMESYTVYMAVEKVKGSSLFPKWLMLGELKAIQLPMCVMIKNYKPWHKVCVAVVGKDKFGRYGPYSEVVTAAIPEQSGGRCGARKEPVKPAPT